MKKNTRKLLLFLYSPNGTGEYLKVSSLPFLFPNLTQHGRVSLTQLLTTRGWLVKDTDSQGEQRIQLSILGKAIVESEFPFLSIGEARDAQATWKIVIFLDSIERDPEFRNLRRTLLQRGWIQIARGVYGFRGEIQMELKNTLQKIYGQSISVFTIGKWLFGKDPAVLSGRNHSNSIIQQYSGISKELMELLNIFEVEKRLNNKRKAQLTGLTDRLYEFLALDSLIGVSEKIEKKQIVNDIHSIRYILRSLSSVR